MSNQKPIKLKKVTIVIPCYNAGFSLVRTVNSLKFQTFKDFEIIIVNDGSNNKLTLTILKSLKQQNLKIINQKNKGLASARNRGALSSDSEFILFLDSDDWLDNRAVELFVKFLNKNKKISYVYSNIVNKNENNAVLKKTFNFFEQLFSNQIPYSILIRREDFIKAGVYDEDMPLMGFEDWDLNIRLGKLNLYGSCLDKNLFFYSVSEEGMLKSVSLKNFSLLYSYIRNKNKNLYKFKNIFKIYLKFYNIKSTHNLLLYFFYNFLYLILSNKLFNYLFSFLLSTFSSSKKNEVNKKKVFSKKNQVKKIGHIITGLELGGAERALLSLMKGIKKQKKVSSKEFIICLKDRAYFSKDLDRLKVKTYYLNMKNDSINFFKQIKLIKILKKENPDLIQSWMYHSDLIGSIASFFLNKKIFWTLHNFDISYKALGIQTRIVVFFCAIFSYFFPDKIISVSKAAIKNHIRAGYKNGKFVHIPLGYKKEKKIIKIKRKKNTLLLGSLSRWNIQKNHSFMLKAFGEFKKRTKLSFNLVLGGQGLDNNNKELSNLIKKNDLVKEVTLLGRVENIKNFYSVIDVHILTSTGEAFPNVICEAMSNGIPCISTNVGDVSDIIGETGWIFESNSYSNFELILKSIFSEIRNQKIWFMRKKLCQLRIQNNFGLDRMIQYYYQVWEFNKNLIGINKS